MNRIIKFKAWDTKNKNWLTAVPTLEYLLDDPDASISHHDIDDESALFWYPSRPMTNDFGGRIRFLQFTGMLDSEGTEVYEGDLIEYSRTFEAKHTSERLVSYVRFDEGKFGFDMTGFNDMFMGLSEDSNVRVIGNIFENKESLS